jgi:serine/threonine-protein kinase RsbW
MCEGGDELSEIRFVSRHWRIPSEFGREKLVLADIRHILMQRGTSSDRLEEIITAVGEACLNAIEHGNQLSKDVNVDVELALSEASCVVRVADQGSGFDLAAALRDRENRHEETDPRGWGLLFITKFCNDVQTQRQPSRFVVQMTFKMGHEREG